MVEKLSDLTQDQRRELDALSNEMMEHIAEAMTANVRKCAVRELVAAKEESHADKPPAERTIAMTTLEQKMRERDEMLATAGHLFSGRYDDLIREEKMAELDREYEQRCRQQAEQQRIMREELAHGCTMSLQRGREDDETFGRRMAEQKRQRERDQALMREGMSSLRAPILSE